MDEIIDAWFAEHFSNSIVSRDTETFNHVHAAKEELKRRLNPNRPEPPAAISEEN